MRSAAIFRGGMSNKLREAGCALLGGHTVRDPEISSATRSRASSIRTK
jgi:hypothetical protein